VRATRAQADRILYKAAIRHRLENQPNLWLFQQAVDDLMVEGERVVGCGDPGRHRLSGPHGGADGGHLPGRQDPCRAQQLRRPAARAIRRRCRLSARLKELKLPQGRLKTGTPPRIDGRSIDFSRCTEQPGDGMPGG
jgi:tRNA uridine 5-carboxymethylaminomethyl modification enzyme